MKLCNATRQVKDLFELVRLHKILDIFDTRDEAVASFAK
jgi:anti-anti-sigma regulatory factor